MNKYKKQISDINIVAKYFASMNYHVTTTFFSQSAGCQITIYFYDINQKESIETYLREHSEQYDSIIFDEYERHHTSDKFYTYKLQKHPS